jgi:hypothetical protein
MIVIYDNISNKVLGGPMQTYKVDGKEGRLEPHQIVLTIVRTDPPSINEDTQYSTSAWVVDGSNYVLQHEVHDKTQQQIAEEKEAATPTEITKRQLLVYLFTNLGVTPQMIDGMIDTYEDPIQRELLRIEWQYATTIDRTLPNVIAFAAAMGITEQELKNIYYFAKNI